MSRARWTGAAFALLVWPALAVAQTSGRSVVAYVSGQSIYISAGVKDGLAVGDSVQVWRADTNVALLAVAYLSSHQASCTILTAAGMVAVGDSVRFAPHPETAAQPNVAATGTSGSPVSGGSGSGWESASRLRGRVALRYLAVNQQDGSSASYSQPALDLRLDGRNLGGSPIGLTADVRSRRTAVSNVDGSGTTDGQARVYQAVLFAGNPGARTRLALGRQYSPALATISLFDGLLAELNRARWSTGAFGGSQPGAVNLEFDFNQKEYGAYFQLHQRPVAQHPWSVTLGAIASYDHSHIDREFAFLQATLAQDHWGFYFAQELDYYNQTKMAAGETSSLSPTSSYGSAWLRLGRTVDVNAGFDNRRTVRYFRDVVTPVTQFDDAFRQGAFGGIGVRLGDAGRLGFDVRASRGGIAGSANAYTASLSLFHLTAAHLFLSGRSTRYTGDRAEGWLHSGVLGLPLAGTLRAEINGGRRQETNLLGFTGPTQNNLWWGGVDLEWGLGSAWFLTGSFTREKGDAQNDTQFYGGLSYRF